MELFKDKKIQLPEDACSLLEEILDAFPYKVNAIRKVMGLGKVRYVSKKGITTAVVNTTPYSLLFGKPFLEENMECMEDLVFLLCHELLHLVFDHFDDDIQEEFIINKTPDKEQKFSRKTINIILDCQVNASCHHLLREPKYLQFLKRYYSQTEMPYCFFREDGIPPTEKLKELHNKLYSEQGISNRELIEGLKEFFEQEQDKIDEMIKKLLGNHSEEQETSDGPSSDNDPANASDVAEAAAQDLSDFIDRPLDPEIQEKLDKMKKGKQAGPGGELLKKQIQTCLDKAEHCRKVRKQITKPRVPSPSGRIFKALTEMIPKHSIRSVIANFHDTRTVSHYVRKGKAPIFNMSPKIGSNNIVPCYLDVSGSQDHVLPHVLPVVARLKKHIGNVVYCFSTVVAEATISELSSGNFRTTGGTDFNILAEHILKHKFKQALILTDGQASLREELIQNLKKYGIDIKVGWTVTDPSLHPLVEVSKQQFFVFDNMPNY